MKKTLQFIILMTILFEAFSCENNSKKINELQTNAKSVYQKHNISNPIPVFETKISGKKGGHIQTPKGAEFIIPKNAFVDASGVPFTHVVTIKLKEYRTASEILLSGIPMTYKDTIMESDGMFDIQAYGDEKPLQLAGGKSIQVSIPALDSMKNDYKLFYLNPSPNNWVIKNQSLKTQPKKKGKNIMDTLKINMEWASMEHLKRSYQGKSFYILPIEKNDISSFYRYHSIDTIINYNGNLDIKTTLSKDTTISIKSFFKLHEKNTENKLKKLISKLNIATQSFPEITYYKNMVWVIHDEKERKRFEAFCNIDTILDAKIINRKIPGNSFVIGLRGKKYNLQIVMDCISSEEDYFENLELYESLLENRGFREENILANKRVQRKNNNKKLLTYSFTIAQLGIWNCDRLYLMPKKETIFVQFKAQNNQIIPLPETIYLVDKNLNSVISFYNNQISFNPESRSILFFINGDGNLCFVEPDLIHKEFSKKPFIALQFKEMRETSNLGAIKELIEQKLN